VTFARLHGASGQSHFCGEHSGGQFATLIVGRASQDGAVEFVSAGHLPLLHLSALEPAVADATGLPLGMFTNASFSVHRLQLAPHDALLVYTAA